MKSDTTLRAVSHVQSLRAPPPFGGRITLICCAIVSFALHLAEADTIQISVGITPNCPYGMAGCWPAAAAALQELDQVAAVAPEPDAYNCTALVSTKDDAIPDPEKWRAQFKQLVGGQYVFRGVELTIEGNVEAKDGRLFLKSQRLSEPMLLQPLRHKLQWNFAKNRARGPEKEEEEEYGKLEALAKRGTTKVRVTGPFERKDGRPVLEVREFLAQSSYTYSADQTYSEDQQPASDAEYP